MNNNDYFTHGAQAVLQLSREAARKMGHNYVGTEHILLAMVKEKSSVHPLLNTLGVNEQSVTERINDWIGTGDFHFTEDFDYTPRTKRVLQKAREEAKRLRQNFVGTEHLLFGILLDEECTGNRILQDLNVAPRSLYDQMMEATSRALQKRGLNIQVQPRAEEAEVIEENDEGKSLLQKYGRDLTAAAKAGELDPVIGRESEMAAVVEILSRRTKNNPVLVGEPGVGKTVVADGLAQNIVSGNVPEMLLDKTLISLDLGSMIAGAKYRGEFEDRLKGVMREIRDRKDVILFIDELHTLIGAGAAEGAIDAANMLKPALARGEMQCIGATTLDEYRKRIEKDSALERRFQPVKVEEPTESETIDILKGLRDRYEAHHKVRITDEAIAACVRLSGRYVSDRFWPDKAIDLMDEASARVRIHNTLTPPDMKTTEERIARLNGEKEEAVAHQDFERAAALRDEEKSLQNEMERQKKDWESRKNSNKSEVSAEDVATILSERTHIPVSRLTESEMQKLLHLEDTLHKRVIGQTEAVSAVSRAIRRARAGLQDSARPIGSFIFLGPTGVGKTELCKALAEALFGDENAMVRLDMSEYMEKHSVSRLIGSPPGYVGYDDGGQLTESVRRKPYCVVLLDEIEKAHPDVFNTFLQVLEDGRLTDSNGRTVDFRNTVIVMTSNVGAKDADKNARGLGFRSENIGLSVQSYERMKEGMLEELKNTFRPEFLNRVDELIVFHALNEEDIHKIAALMLGSVAERLSEKDIELHWTDDALDFIAREGFDVTYGARPLRRAIQRSVEDNLSEALLSGEVILGDTVEMSVQDEKLHFQAIENAVG